MNCVLSQAAWLSLVKVSSYLLVARDASIDSCINDTIQAHAEQIDVAMHLFVLVLADQSS